MPPASVDLRPASAFDADALAAVFSAGYEGYWFPIALDGAAFARMARIADADLDASRVALVDGGPVGIALAARRGTESWVAGMGVAAGHRRAGIGGAMLRSALDAVHAAGAERVTLEVLEQNEPARGLYQRLGFEPCARARGLECRGCAWCRDDGIERRRRRGPPLDRRSSLVRGAVAAWRCERGPSARARRAPRSRQRPGLRRQAAQRPSSVGRTAAAPFCRPRSPSRVRRRCSSTPSAPACASVARGSTFRPTT